MTGSAEVAGRWSRGRGGAVLSCRIEWRPGGSAIEMAVRGVVLRKRGRRRAHGEVPLGADLAVGGKKATLSFTSVRSPRTITSSSKGKVKPCTSWFLSFTCPFHALLSNRLPTSVPQPVTSATPPRRGRGHPSTSERRQAAASSVCVHLGETKDVPHVYCRGSRYFGHRRRHAGANLPQALGCTDKALFTQVSRTEKILTQVVEHLQTC